jgi:hypothetical protein
MRREFLVMTRDSHFFQLRAHARQYALAIKLNHVPLIRLARVDIHDRCATVEEVDQRLRVNVRICADRPFAVDLFKREFGSIVQFRVDVVIFAAMNFLLPVHMLPSIRGPRLTPVSAL